MNIASYLDSTYLKTAEQAGLSIEENKIKVLELLKEAQENDFLLAMIRPDMVKMAYDYYRKSGAKVKIGTVIGFPQGTFSIDEKLKEAQTAIQDGADELDFVINYTKYIAGNKEEVKEEFLRGTKLALENGIVVKWIIEIAALTDDQIQDISKDIATWAEEAFTIPQQNQIFIKSSTGFFNTKEGKPNGATKEGISLMKKNAGNLKVKAAGGVRSHKEALEMIDLGVERIGTSSAKSLLDGQNVEGGY